MAKLCSAALAAVMGIGLLACGDAPTTRVGAVASPVDAVTFRVTTDDRGVFTGATRTTLEGEVDRVRVYFGHQATNHTLPTGEFVPRDWDMVRTDWTLDGRLALTQYLVVEPLSHITVTRSFLWNAHHEELTCLSDFSQWRSVEPAHGVVAVDYRADAVSVDFRTGKWRSSEPAPDGGLACSHPSFDPVFAKIGAAWAPFLAEYDASLDRQIAALYTSFDPARPGDGVAAPAGLMIRADLTEDEKYALKRAVLAGLIGAAGGARGGPWVAAGGFALGFSGSLLASYLEADHAKAQQEERNRRGQPTGPTSDRRRGDRSEGDPGDPGRQGGYVPPSPGDVGWDGEPGDDGDGTGMHAGDTSGGNYGGSSWPGGSGPSPTDGDGGGTDHDECAALRPGEVAPRAWCL